MTAGPLQRKAVEIGRNRPKPPSGRASVIWSSLIMLSIAGRVAEYIRAGGFADVVGLTLAVGFIALFVIGASRRISSRRKNDRTAGSVTAAPADTGRPVVSGRASPGTK